MAIKAVNPATGEQVASYEAMTDADLTLVVVDLSCAGDEADEELIAQAAARGRYLVVGNKCDLARRYEGSAIGVSALTGEGVEQLRTGILAALTPEGVVQQEAGFVTSIRHERLLRESLESLDLARTAVESSIPHEMVLLDLYSALRPLDAITGATTADDILNRIFSTFCIGK